MTSGLIPYTNTHEFTSDVDISSKRFWARSFAERELSFARLRATAPVSWHPPVESAEYFGETGFWAVTRADDIRTVSMNSQVFQSKYGITLTPSDPVRATAATFILTMDPPEHGMYRRLIKSAFTPRAIKQIADRIAVNASAIVDDMLDAREFDFVEQCSMRLPLSTVSDIVGVPESERAGVAHAAESLVGGAGVGDLPSEKMDEALLTALLHLFQTGAALAAHRRTTPGDDLMTNLVEADIDGHRLTDDEIGAFMVLISVAGNDTTKQTTSWSALALSQRRQQRDWLLEDFDGLIGSSVEEFVRFASPVIQFTRTAAEDTVLGDAQISAGDKVAIFYCSGNRDETIFERADEFDLSRPRVPHLGFGGGGAHFCLGSGVARTQLSSMFQQLLKRIPDLQLGEPELLESNFINGISKLPAAVS